MSPLHASAVLLDGDAVILLGGAGSGKSTLALHLIQAHGATLIGDDRLFLHAHNGGVDVAPHERLAGLIEMRGLGLLRLPYAKSGRLALVVRLVAPEDVPRLAAAHFYPIEGHDIACLSLDGHDPHSAMKIKWALAALHNGFRDDAIYPLDGHDEHAEHDEIDENGAA
jgi:HPr kinase/phosphorylase